MLSKLFNRTIAAFSVMAITCAVSGYQYGLHSASTNLQNSQQIDKTKPILTVAGIVYLTHENKFAIIERGKKPFGIALFGGHVEARESPENAFVREAREELNVDVENLELIGLHGSYGRDPRQHSVEGTYFATTSQTPAAGSDAKKVMLYTKDELMSKLSDGKTSFAFDHGEILKKFFNDSDNNHLYSR
jgi:8-oxo-dGTP diphosphatase